MMKYLFTAILLMVTVVEASGPSSCKQPLQGPPGPTGPAGPTGPEGDPGVFTSSYAHYFSTEAQVDIEFEDVVEVTAIGSTQMGGWGAPTGGVITVPADGTYALYYSVTTNDNSAVALAVNGVVIAGTGSSSPANNRPMTGNAILPLVSGDTLAILSIENPLDTFDTVLSLNTSETPSPVSLVLFRISN